MSQVKLKAWAAMAASLGVVVSVQAQTIVLPPSSDAAALQQRQIEQSQRESEQLRRKAAPNPDAESTGVVAPAAPRVPPVPAGAEKVRFVLKTVSFSESAYFQPAQLQALAAPLIGQTISLVDLNGLLEKVNALYAERKIATATAILPPQDVTEGVVSVRLVEGRVGSIDVVGNNSTDADFVRHRLGLKPEDLVDLDVLERAVTRMNRTQDIRLGVEAKPGERFGYSDLVVGLQEPPRHEVVLTVDNLGSKLTGEWRLGLSYRNRSVLGFRDDLLLSWTHAAGQESRMLQYGFPFNPWGGRISLGYFWDETEIRKGPLTSLNITGESKMGMLSLRQPLWVTPTWMVELTGGYKDRDSRNIVSGVLLKTEHSQDHSYGAEVQHFGDSHHLAAGLSETRVQIDPQGTLPTRYRVHRGFVRHTQLLPHELSLRSSLSWQGTPDRYLPSAEQMFLGGEGSVRGYPSGTYAGDRGHALSLELHHPLGQWQPGPFAKVSATGFAFIDHGDVKPYNPPGSVAQVGERLTGIGWGLLAHVNNRHTVRLTAGVGLDRVKQDPKPPRNYQVTVQLLSKLY